MDTTETTTIKKKKGPLFWIILTSILWFLISCTIVTAFLAYLMSKKEIQKYVLNSLQQNLGIETNLSDDDKTLRELELENKIETLEKELDRLKIKEEIRNEILNEKQEILPTQTPTKTSESLAKPEEQDLPLCVDKCGDGICAEIVCMGSGCPCAEDAQSCPEDCI